MSRSNGQSNHKASNGVNAKATRTEAQRLASRRNGARGQGPRTDAGKRRSRRNALKTGVYSEDPAIWARGRADKVGLRRRLRKLRDRYGDCDGLTDAELRRHAGDCVTLDRYHRIRDALLAAGTDATEAEHAQRVAAREKHVRDLRRLRRTAQALADMISEAAAHNAEPVAASMASSTGPRVTALAQWMVKRARNEQKSSRVTSPRPPSGPGSGDRVSFQGQGLDVPPNAKVLARLLGESAGDKANRSRSASLLALAETLLSRELDDAEHELVAALDARELYDLALVDKLPKIDTIEKQITRVSRRIDRERQRFESAVQAPPAVSPALSVQYH